MSVIMAEKYKKENRKMSKRVDEWVWLGVHKIEFDIVGRRHTCLMFCGSSHPNVHWLQENIRKDRSGKIF